MKKTLCFFVWFLSLHINAQVISDCTNCSKQLITHNQINELGVDEVQFLINDLYARKGYQFSNTQIQLFFENQSWYKNLSNNNKVSLNATEQKNISFFKSRINELYNERILLTDALNSFKSAFLKKDIKLLNSNFNFPGEENLLEGTSYDYLKDVFDRININDLRWMNNTSLYRVTIDNLDTTTTYKLKILGEDVYIYYDFDSGSEEIQDNLYPTEYFTEFTYAWIFKWKNKRLTFLHLSVAG